MSAVRAKGKMRREAMEAGAEADAEALKKHNEAVLKTVVKSSDAREKKARDEAESYEIVAVFEAEIQQIYEEDGFRLDDANAHDKALTLWRELRHRHHIRTHHHEIPHRLCQEHS
jgi:hypothetical protein